MSWLQKIMPSRMSGVSSASKKGGVPEGVWSKCGNCGAVLYRVEMERALYVCPKCNAHQRVNARTRLDMFLDADNREEISGHLEPLDPLKFRDSKKYRDRLTQAQKKTGEKEAIVVMRGAVKAMPVVVGAMDFNFMGGSMGSVVGEAIVEGIHAAIDNDTPFVLFCASGGARMQEGLFSLMQMGKTSAALTRLAERGLPFVSVLTHPTMGGVAASYAMLGDINVAEPGALVGFAGPRVIEQTVQQTLPAGFQRSEFLLEHGAVDMIVERKALRDDIHNVLSVLCRQQAAIEPEAVEEELPLQPLPDETTTDTDTGATDQPDAP